MKIECRKCQQPISWEQIEGLRLCVFRNGRNEYKSRCGCGELIRDSDGNVLGPIHETPSIVKKLTDLLSEVYETQSAACVGRIKNTSPPAPCGKCLWCRVRDTLEELKEKKT